MAKKEKKSGQPKITTEENNVASVADEVLTSDEALDEVEELFRL